jgi:hypothetical protein
MQGGGADRRSLKSFFQDKSLRSSLNWLCGCNGLVEGIVFESGGLSLR